VPTALPELTPEEIAKAAEASKGSATTSGEVIKH
jgi:hypothetical protein